MKFNNLKFLIINRIGIVVLSLFSIFILIGSSCDNSKIIGAETQGECLAKSTVKYVPLCLQAKQDKDTTLLNQYIQQCISDGVAACSGLYGRPCTLEATQRCENACINAYNNNAKK